MTPRLIRVLLRLMTAMVLVVALFSVWINDARAIEAHTTGWLLTAMSVSGIGAAYGPELLILPAHGLPFRVEVSPSCSSMGAILGLAAIALFLMHGPILRRLLAFAAAAGIVIAGNLFRITTSVWIGLEWGSQYMTIYHDWIGTVIGLVVLLTAFMVMLFLLLPSNKRILEDATRDR